MPILKSGTFNTKLYRRAIPAMVKLKVVLRSEGLCECFVRTAKPCGVKIGKIDDCEFNHNPALADRDYDTDAEGGRGDFIPPQHDPATIYAERIECHKVHTSGTKATSRGSVVGERARTKRLQKAEAEHKAKREAWKQGLTPHQVREHDNVQALLSDVKEIEAYRAADTSFLTAADNVLRRALDDDGPRGQGLKSSQKFQGRKMQGQGFRTDVTRGFDGKLKPRKSKRGKA